MAKGKQDRYRMAQKVREPKAWTEDEMREVLAAARTAFHMKGSTPSMLEVQEYCKLAPGRVAVCLSDEIFIKCMDAYGIKWKQHSGLTAQQHHILMIMTDPNDRRTFPVRLRECGITATTYRNWMKDPQFAGVIERFSESALSDHMAQAHDSLMKNVAKGDQRSLEFYYAMTGRYNPNSQVERDINAVMMQIIEIVTSEVTDPATLQRIATRMKKLMEGGAAGPSLVQGEAVPLEEKLDAGLALPLDLAFVDYPGDNVQYAHGGPPVANVIPPLEEFKIGDI